jgi:hypothetical protein
MTGKLYRLAERRRFVPRPPQPRRLEVRISVADARLPFGRSRPFRIAEDNLRQLIDHALRLEARA